MRPKLFTAVSLVAVVVETMLTLVVLAAGLLQFTAWKMRQLACCRSSLLHRAGLADDRVASFRYGLLLALHCILCCVGLMAILVVTDVMDLSLMAAVTVTITVERLAPASARVAKGLGVVIVGAALVLIGRAILGLM